MITKEQYLALSTDEYSHLCRTKPQLLLSLITAYGIHLSVGYKGFEIVRQNKL